MKTRNYWDIYICLQTEKDITTQHTSPDMQLQAYFQLSHGF